MPSIADAVAQILAVDLPVLFPDTCVLLDVIRGTKRRIKDCAARAAELYALAAAPPKRCVIVIGSVVTLEWNTRAPEVLDDVKKHLIEIQDQAAHFHDAAGVLGIGLSFGRPSYPTAGWRTPCTTCRSGCWIRPWPWTRTPPASAGPIIES